MEDKQIKQIIIDQRSEIEGRIKKEKIIPRETFGSVKSLMKSNLVKVIMGVRRCGKSVFSYQIVKESNFGYVNFDDERFYGFEAGQLNKILAVLYELYGKMDFVFLDEIQNVEGWELFVNRLQREGHNTVVTGSNANLLSKELATHLTGRHIAIELHPFSFREFVSYKGFELKENFTTKEISELRILLEQYIQIGGFPEVLKGEEPKTYLSSLYSTIITKDILLRYKIKFVKTFKDIAAFLISNSGNQISFNKIKNTFGLRSDHTAKNYVNFMEETYLILVVPRLMNKYKESLAAPRKVYCIDTGLVNAVGFKISKDQGRKYENIVAVELQRRKRGKDIDVFYWQDIQKREVDFVIKKGLRIEQLIQVTYYLGENKEREVRSLLQASKELKCNNLLVITDDYEGEEVIKRKKIKFIPLWKWLLEVK